MIEQGWEAALPALTEAQQAAETRLLVDLARTTLKPMRGLGVIRNARIFDSGTARLRPGGLADVFVLRGRISAILPAGSPQLRHADQEIDAAGRVLLPGLFDMHAHIDRWDGGLHLAGGVTTVRDMGNNNAKLQTLMDETAAGDLLHPRIVPSGLLEGESPMAFRNGFVIETLQQARDAVDWYAVHGYPQLKIYNSFPRAMVREIAAYAHSRGLRVSGHVPVTMRASEAVEQGYDEIQHINQVMLEFLVTPSTDTRTLERFYLPAEKLAGLNLDSKRVTDFVALLKRRGTVIDPTLATFDFIKQRDGELAAPYAAIADHLPPDVRRSLLTGGMKIPDSETAARYRASYARMVEFVGRLYRAGVPLVAGTDAMAGFTLHSELELYVKAGLTPGQALQIATRNGARYTRTSADRGSIEVGKLADLVLVDGDPTRQISDLRRVALVLTQGRLMSPSQIYTSLGVRPFVDKEPQLRQREASRAASTLDAGQGHDSAAAVGPARHGHAH
jgi:cytosine/adenosine deaminase-related metal-dependent hydrolase